MQTYVKKPTKGFLFFSLPFCAICNTKSPFRLISKSVLRLTIGRRYEKGSSTLAGSSGERTKGVTYAGVPELTRE